MKALTREDLEGALNVQRLMYLEAEGTSTKKEHLKEMVRLSTTLEVMQAHPPIAYPSAAYDKMMEEILQRRAG